MNYGRAFTYMTDDPQWLKKFAIAALLCLTIIGGIPVLGWGLEITRRVLNGEPDLLPEWDNFGDFVVKGLQVFVISFVYSLPSIIVNVCTRSLPLIVENINGDAAQAIGSVVTVVSLCLGCILFFYSIAIWFYLPAAVANFAATGEIGAAFRFNEILGLLRAAPGPYIIVLLLSIVTYIITLIGIIACVIGIFVTGAYSLTVNVHLWGQAYKVAKSMPGSLPPMAPAAPSM